MSKVEKWKSEKL